MDNTEALSALEQVLGRLDQLEASIEAEDGDAVEKVFELMAAREIIEGLREKFDDDSECQRGIVRIDLLMEQLELSPSISDSRDESS